MDRRARPAAWTKGEDFRPAKRRPARSIIYFDRFGITGKQGPVAELRLADGPGANVREPTTMTESSPDAQLVGRSS